MGLSFWLASLAFDLPRSPLLGILVVIATNLAQILPSAPAAVGVFEAATLVALTAYGAPRPVALSYAVVFARHELPPLSRGRTHGTPSFSGSGLTSGNGRCESVPRLMRVSFLVPAHDEAPTIGEVLSRIDALDLETEVIVVDDGSTDDTAEIVNRWASQRDHILLLRQNNRSKGAAIRAAIPHASGEIVVIQDADMEYDLPRCRC
jgi:glycosyl transferase family 2/lysylphosphatidylglycerol synthase-like protein